MAFGRVAVSAMAALFRGRTSALASRKTPRTHSRSRDALHGQRDKRCRHAAFRVKRLTIGRRHSERTRASAATLQADLKTDPKRDYACGCIEPRKRCSPRPP